MSETFHLPATCEADRRDTWQEMLSKTHLPWTTQLSVPEQEFDAAVQRWWIDDLALVDCVCGPTSGTRQRRHIADTDGDFFVVMMNLAGRETISHGDESVCIGSGDVVLWDSSLPARFAVHERLSKRSLIVPHSAIDEIGGKPWAVPRVMIGPSSSSVQLLSAYLDALAQVLPTLSPSEIVAARNATLALLIGVIRPDTGGASTYAGPALRAAIDRYIEQHLLGGELSLEAIAKAHAVSVRTVSRAYSATGQTVGGVIRSRRLARARQELAETDQSVARIAGRLGFSDASHLSRAFKAFYGLAPTDFRAHGA